LGFKATNPQVAFQLQSEDTACAILPRKKGKTSGIAIFLHDQNVRILFSFFISGKRTRALFAQIERDRGRQLLGLSAGFRKNWIRRSTGLIRGINILGGQPKAGKSCFFHAGLDRNGEEENPGHLLRLLKTDARRSTREPFAG